MEIREVMTAWVVTAPPGCTAREAAETMRDRDVGCIVFVTEQDPPARPVGLVTDRDLTLGVLADGGSADDPAILHASSPVLTAGPEMDIDGAIALMTRHQIRRLPVLEEGQVIGIVTMTDLLARCDAASAARVIAAQNARRSLPASYYQD
jgi:CBS domain-containing protein